MPVIPDIQKAEIRRISIPDQSGQDPISTEIKKMGMVRHSCNPSYARGKSRRITI
jgi:hypothetical protein